MSILRQLQSVHHGFLYEGDIFSVISHSPFAVRSSELALVDGAVDCTRSYDCHTSFADRFWRVQSFGPQEWSDLLLFDVKSSLSAEAGAQRYVGPALQQRKVAFHLAVCAGNPAFVALIPNYSQDATTREVNDDDDGDGDDDTRAGSSRAISANVARYARLPPSAYGNLDPCSSPDRMPLSSLAEALRRVRCHARGESIYANPATGVSHPEWKPGTVQDPRWLRPRDSTDNFTAYERMLEIQQALHRDRSFKFDFVGLAPFLADFKFILTRSAGTQRQCYVQHKVDGRLRRLGSPLDSVFIARAGVHYFRSSERFDFLMYHFDFNSKPPYRECFFIPEKVIPAHFYTTTETEATFELEEFVPYRINMADDLLWINSIRKIIEANVEPRRRGPPPERSLAKSQAALPDTLPSVKLRAIRARSGSPPAGRHQHRTVMDRSHRRFFYGIMAECARRGKGLIILLARDHPVGDFAYCRYQWTPEQQRLFLDHNQIPAFEHDLPPETPCIPVCLYARHHTNWHQGPKVTAAVYRRLNATSLNRLVLWDVGGQDTDASLPLMAVVPSDDIQPVAQQRAIFEANLGQKRGTTSKNGWAARTPSVSDILATGLHLGEYVLPLGPLAYDNPSWAPLYALLDTFAGLADFQHPDQCARDPTTYQHALRVLQTRLSQEHCSNLAPLKDVDSDE
ncbi:hypothetical protein LTR12_010988 [Friedmanniomyces endolithicus]|nr:hypothetical protein LTR12_010988 [Friedmanniomyces endolithicus]